MKRFDNKRIRYGFTLLEVIVAIFLVTVGIVSAFALINANIKILSSSPDKITAVYLAQEGIEIVRNIRDTSWVNGKVWTEDLQPGNWEADYTTTSFSKYESGAYNWTGFDSTDYLNISSDGFYNYTSSGTKTTFLRKISISYPETHIMNVLVTVYWREKDVRKNFSVEAKLYNWH